MLLVMSTLRIGLTRLGLTALSGMALWLVIAGVALAVDEPALELPAVLLLFGQLVVVPLGLGELRWRSGPVPTALIRAAWWLWRPAALAAIVAIAVPQGELAAGVAALALLPAIAVGVAALASLPEALRSWSGVARGAASGFLAVGALAFVLHRQGGAVAGFPEHLVQLTAIHFHIAGFGLALLAARLAERRPSIGRVAVALHIAGLVVTPIGFLASPFVQAAGAVLVSLAAVSVGIGTAVILPQIRSRPARLLLLVSSLGAGVVALLATTYAVTEALGSPAIELSVMAAIHGTIAAVAVVGAGLAAWRLEGPR
jgi:hypothetical protein